jgi:hypothetical protein
VTVRPAFEKLRTPSARPLQRPCTRKVDAFTVVVCSARSNVTLTFVFQGTPPRWRTGLVETTCNSPTTKALSSADSEAAARRLVKARTPTRCDVLLLLMAS